MKIRLFIVFSLFSTSLRAEGVIDRKPLAIGTKIETGQVVDGENNQWVGEDPDKFYLSHIGVNLTQEVVVNKKMELKVGVGGVFFYSFPERRGNAGSQGTKFGPGVSQAQALFKFGDPSAPRASLRVGYFPYKYNPDSKNLGEYLFRSMPYPAVVTTGGWAITDNAQIRAQGIQFRWSQLGGKLNHDFLLTSERDFRPQGDFTPSYVLEANLGPLQIGGGVAFHHFLPIDGKRSETIPGNLGADRVLVYGSFPAFAAYHDEYAGIDKDTIYHAQDQPLTATWADIQNGVLGPANPNLSELTNDSIQDVSTGIIYAPVDTLTFTTQGVKLMARASFSLQKMVPMDFLGPEDLKFYAEAALLGWKDQKPYYDNRWKRVPLMIGVNLPVFRLLDVLSLEVEYYPSPLPDDLENIMSGNYNPLPPRTSVVFMQSSQEHRDDWKWSLYAAKKVLTGFSLRAQVANDHIRAPQLPPNQHLFNSVPITRNPTNWYYVVTLNFGI